MFKWLLKKNGGLAKLVTSNHHIQKKQFNRMISVAEEIFKKAEEHQVKTNYKHPILNYVKLLGMNLQTDYITNLLYDDDHEDIQKYPSISPWLPFFDLSLKVSLDGKNLHDMIFCKVENRVIEVDLNQDLVLPWPWNFSRFVNSISSIGVSRPWGEWKQDTSNHDIQILLPMGICFVGGGNHSIASGIIYGEGKLHSEDIYDFSEIYKYVYTDGLEYRRVEDGSKISDVKNLEFAVIFEVGRMMSERELSR
ncbi:hypothetical protein L2089_10030 [Paenibacillus hunanensis]|uniref:DUF6710 family protein n=1 Tax=Paenibacillus hunanensis TaxID=539262 RepID=UPI002025F872|nr:DUF6710 family protein [Paenibacillus hunanensis]MCL9661023.1 hypothetical protein [Paenibacillus hunanensis]